MKKVARQEVFRLSRTITDNIDGGQVKTARKIKKMEIFKISSQKQGIIHFLDAERNLEKFSKH